MSNGFEEIIAEASPQVEALARGTKALIQNVMPDVVEVPWPKQRIIGYGVGPKKMSEHFCYIGIFENRVNLGFYYGAELPDPENLLEGSGKLLRHIKIAKIEQLENPAIHRLVAAAAKHLPKLDKT
jgi:hypothetical protein